MSELRLNILYAGGAIHGTLPGADCDRVIAALSADPETIEELETALGRYCMRPGGCKYLANFKSGVCHEPWDAGLILIDLVARVIGRESTFSALGHEGDIRLDLGECEKEHKHSHDGGDNEDDDDEVDGLYHLAADWKFEKSLAEFEIVAASRRERKQNAPRRDARAVLYGGLAEHFVPEVLARREALVDLDEPGQHELIRELHKRWLMTPHAGLAGQTPRETLLDYRHEHMERDLHYQTLFWSFFRRAPPAVSRDSAAYRDSGFGHHEVVLYYDLVRDVLSAYLDRVIVSGTSPLDASAEIEHFKQHQQELMHQGHEESPGRTPVAMIDRERRRMPEAHTPEEEKHVIDHDCPLCQMAADGMFGPGFWGLDGSHMDENFEFSFYATREEWEEEQRRSEEFHRKFAEEWAEKEKARREGREVEGEDEADGELPF